MAKNKVKELILYRRRVTALERAIARTNRQLLALPARFGCASMGEFVALLQWANRNRSSVKPARKSAGSGSRRKRITDTMKDRVRELVADGQTGLAIARQLGISPASVQNIKNELGLVRRRKPTK